MILQLQAKVHGLGNLGVSTYTYLSLSEFKATFCLSHSSRLNRMLSYQIGVSSKQ